MSLIVPKYDPYWPLTDTIEKLRIQLEERDILIRRAAELLRHIQVVFPNWYRSDVEQWLKDSSGEGSTGRGHVVTVNSSPAATADKSVE